MKLEQEKLRFAQYWIHVKENKTEKLSAFKREPRATMLCKYYTNAMQVLCKCCASAVQVLCKCFTIASQLQCNCNSNAMQV